MEDFRANAVDIDHVTALYRVEELKSWLPAVVDIPARDPKAGVKRYANKVLLASQPNVRVASRFRKAIAEKLYHYIRTAVGTQDNALLQTVRVRGARQTGCLLHGGVCLCPGRTHQPGHLHSLPPRGWGRVR